MPVDPFSLTNPDVVCVNDLDPYGTECTSDFQVLQQDVYHLLVEDPGSNIDDPGRGIGVYSYLSASANDFTKLGHLIDQQLELDDRINSSQATLTQQPDGSWLIVIEIELATGTIGALQFALSQAGGLQIAQ